MNQQTLNRANDLAKQIKSAKSQISALNNFCDDANACIEGVVSLTINSSRESIVGGNSVSFNNKEVVMACINQLLESELKSLVDCEAGLESL